MPQLTLPACWVLSQLHFTQSKHRRCLDRGKNSKHPCTILSSGTLLSCWVLGGPLGLHLPFLLHLLQILQVAGGQQTGPFVSDDLLASVLFKACSNTSCLSSLFASWLLLCPFADKLGRTGLPKAAGKSLLWDFRLRGAGSSVTTTTRS